MTGPKRPLRLPPHSPCPIFGDTSHSHPCLLMYLGALPGRREGSLKANQRSTGSLKTYAWPAGLLTWPLEFRAPLQGHMWPRFACRNPLPTYLSSLTIVYISSGESGTLSQAADHCPLPSVPSFSQGSAEGPRVLKKFPSHIGP